MKTKIKSNLTWHLAESKISEEMQWLRSVLPISDYDKDQRLLAWCYRQIALWLVVGQIRIIQYCTQNPAKDLWGGYMIKIDDKENNMVSSHGSAWHQNTIDILKKFFEQKNCKVIFQPHLNLGRADLGIYRDEHDPLFIEVGNTSILKLEFNLRTMRDCTFLIVPNAKRCIEIMGMKTEQERMK